jgi:hypothetical protein
MLLLCALSIREETLPVYLLSRSLVPLVACIVCTAAGEEATLDEDLAFVDTPGAADGFFLLVNSVHAEFLLCALSIREEALPVYLFLEPVLQHT